MPHVDDGTLHAYLDGELSAPEAEGVEAHVAQCAGCRSRLDEERALITRAAELLGRAAPPDRELPPFRAGDVKAPVRLWWQVRLPLAWAATVALALGIGTYLAPRQSDRARSPNAQVALDSVGTIPSQPQTAPAPASAPAPVARALAQGALRTKRRDTTRALATRQPAVPAPRAPQAATDQIARQLAAARPAPAVYAPAPASVRAEAGAVLEGKIAAQKAALQLLAVRDSPIDADSARLLLGTDLRVVPDLPIRGMYRARLMGYAGVIIEQALDSSTVIEVINGRPAPMALSDVVVTGAATPQADSMSAARALPSRAADSQPADERRRVTPPSPAPRADHPVAGLLLEVRGPLSPDSLAALRSRLRPLRP